jgi:voltage-gated potassium channel
VPGRLEKHKHLLLLAAVLFALVTQPLLAHEIVAAQIAYDLLVGGITVGVLFVVFGERWERQVALVLLLPAVALTFALYTVSPRLALPAAVAYHISTALFVAYAVGVIVRDIFRRHAIRFDEVIGAFCGYLLLGLVWGNLYVVVELLAPGSFAIAPDIRWQLDDPHLRRALFNYVSFATIASLGYNDVTAVAPLANILTWFEAMSAQFYLAVVIAQIVGMKLAQVVGTVGPWGR